MHYKKFLPPEKPTPLIVCHFEWQFLVKVGVWLKFYSRVGRFSILSNRVAHSERVNWQDIVFENGYHDRSHLAREYQEFYRMNPSEYHASHHELSRLVKD